MVRKLRWCLALSLLALVIRVLDFDRAASAERDSLAAAAPQGAEATAAPAALPPYFNQDASKAKPDPTGGAAGASAAPAGDGKGDIPSALSNADLYDRIAHN